MFVECRLNGKEYIGNTSVTEKRCFLLFLSAVQCSAILASSSETIRETINRNNSQRCKFDTGITRIFLVDFWRRSASKLSIIDKDRDSQSKSTLNGIECVRVDMAMTILGL